MNKPVTTDFLLHLFSTLIERIEENNIRSLREALAEATALIEQYSEQL